MKPVHILLVEDNEGDIVLTLEAFRDVKYANTISVVRDGEEAVQYLSGEGQHCGAGLPDLILLDINLPRMDGKEVLAYIKNNNRLKCIPVVMLTTSSSDKDIADSYCSFANCYITKPVDFEKFIHVIRSVGEFWLSIVQLPVKK